MAHDHTGLPPATRRTEHSPVRPSQEAEVAGETGYAARLSGELSAICGSARCAFDQAVTVAARVNTKRWSGRLIQAATLRDMQVEYHQDQDGHACMASAETSRN